MVDNKDHTQQQLELQKQEQQEQQQQEQQEQQEQQKEETENINLVDLFRYWYNLGHQQAYRQQTKPIKCINLNDNHLQDLWTNVWFAKNKEQQEIDKYLKMYEGLLQRTKKQLQPKVENNEDFSQGMNIVQKFGTIILFDQIPRNIYRCTAQAYETDIIARILCKGLISEHATIKDLVEIYPLHLLITLCLTLCHSENMDDQNTVKDIVQAIKDKYSPGKFVNIIEVLKQIHTNHIDRIQLFGRIPERNRWLNRQTTDQEKVYMNQVDGSYM